MKYLLIIFILFIYTNQQTPKKKAIKERNPKRKLSNYLDCINNLYEEEKVAEFVIFIDLKIYLDTIYLFEQLETKGLQRYKEPLVNAMNKAAEVLESFLKIYKGWYPKDLDEDKEIRPYVENWNKTLLGNDVDDADSMFEKGISFIILFKLDETMDDEKIAIAKPIIFDVCGNPEVGLVSLNPNKNYNEMPEEYLATLMLHQFSHLLAFNGAILNDEKGNFKNNLSPTDDENRFYLKSDKVMEYAKKYFGITSDSFDGVEIVKDENDNYHWSSRYLLGEYMTDLSNIEEQVISGFTLALFEDLGYLKVKSRFTGGLMRFGKNQGLNFVDEFCIGSTDSNNKEIKFKNEFYYPESDKINDKFEEPSCSSGRLSKTIHKLIKYPNFDDIPPEYVYFSDNPLLGGLSSTNYCPVSMASSETIYGGRCSQTNGSPNTDFGESFSSNSFCALSSLVKNTVNNYNSLSQTVTSVCFEMFCSEKSLTIKYGDDDYFVCPREGGKIEGVGFAGYLLCPDYNLICTGSTICNNIFNCIEKESTEKDSSFLYDDYGDILTTQESKDYKAQSVVIGKELAESNSICPKNCAQCKKSNADTISKCIKCGNGYDLKGSNDSDEIICVESSQLTKGFYQNLSNSVYYPCISNCEQCENGNTCQTCSKYYKVKDNICVNKVENCNSYDTNEICTGCDVNYSLVKSNNGEISCILKTDLQSRYYPSVEGEITYYKLCSEAIPNCYTCTSATSCSSCIDGYGLIDNNYGTCQEITNSYYFDSDLNSYKLCSNKNAGCTKCDKIDNNNINCIECDSANNYVLIYSEINKCALQSLINNDKSIFYDSQTLKYFSCSDSRYHKVKNCLTCQNSSKCESCQNGYEISNSNELCVSTIKINQQKYFLNKLGNNLNDCSQMIRGCERCEDSNSCLECNTAFDLDENNKCIPHSLALTRYYLDENTKKYISCSKIENCEQCSSSKVCTRCKSGYELDNDSCKKYKENNNSLSLGALILGVIGTVISIIAIILYLFKNIFSKNSPSVSSHTESNSPELNNDQNINVVSSKRNIKNNSE